MERKRTEIEVQQAMANVKQARITNSKQVAKLNEQGKVLEEEERKLKLRIEEHCGLVEGVKEEGRRLEEEEKGLQVELDQLNRPPLIVSKSQPDSQVGQSLLVKQLKPIFPTEIFMCITPHLPAKGQLSLRSLNKAIRSNIPKVLRLNFRYFRDSFDSLVSGFNKRMLICEIPVNFTLDPMEVELNPYRVLEMGESILEGDYYFNPWPAVHALLGPSLKDAVSEILRRGHKHPKFKLLTLELAAYANCPQALQFLLSANDNAAIPQTDFENALYVSSMGGYDEIVQILLQNRRTDPACYGNFAIQLAAQEGHTSTVQLLLQDHRVSPEAEDNQAIRAAAVHGHAEVITLLLEDERVDMKARNFESLWFAHKRNHQVCVKLLLDHFVAHPGVHE